MNSFQFGTGLSSFFVADWRFFGLRGTVFFFAGDGGLTVCIFGFQSSRYAAKKALAVFWRRSSLKTW